MIDLTILFLTINKVPKKWAAYHRKVLTEAIGDYPLITITKEPTDWGTNIIQTEPEGVSNIYWQILKGAKLAKTPYIAIVEDDTLYPKEHFNEFRPPLDTFGYNMNRSGLFTWGKPTYFWKLRVANSMMIAPRELTIEALEERFKKYPDGMPERIVGELGRWQIEKMLGVTVRKLVEFYTTIAIISLNHDFAIDPLERSHRKRMGMIRAYDIPYWGKAKEVVTKFN